MKMKGIFKKSKSLIRDIICPIHTLAHECSTVTDFREEEINRKVQEGFWVGCPNQLYIQSKKHWIPSPVTFLCYHLQKNDSTNSIKCFQQVQKVNCNQFSAFQNLRRTNST